MLQTIVLSQAMLWALAACRISGFVVGSPFPGAYVAATQRTGLVVGLAWVTSMFATPSHVPHDIGPAFFVSCGLELACGLVIGLAFRLIFFAADTTGQLLSTAVGLSSASVLNPSIEVQDTIVSRIVTLLALLLALGAGVHRVALGYLLASFRAIPVGSVAFSSSSAMLFIDIAILSFTVGVQLAMPAVGVALVVQVGLAMTARAAPSLQIFSVGFTVLMLTGFVVIIACLRDIGTGLLLHFGTLSSWLDALLVGADGSTL
jgi:flagellar biosynthetic protein FliR